ncbi:MAG: prepilin-type N-terminal cleavage/methylation domain-containing protein [Actinomycetota bacterium]
MRRHRRPDSTRAEDGFTLVELVVALALVAVVAVGFTVSIGLGFRSVAIARQRQTASELSSGRLEHMRNVPYEQVALSTAPIHDPDELLPDHWVSADGSTYDTNGDEPGGVESLIVDTTAGQVLHLEDPVEVGATVMEIYQYVTWVDDGTIVGTQDYRRITVVVRYKAPAANGVNVLQRASTFVTPGTVTVGVVAPTTAPATTTPTTTPGTTAPTTAAPTTAVPAGPCAGDTTGPTGGFTIGAGGGSEAGFTATSNVSLQLAFVDVCEPVVANFSNDGVTWGTDVTYDASNPQVSWSLPAGNGLKTVFGRVRDGAGNLTGLVNATVTLDATAPSAPTTVNTTVSCQGSNRTATLSWSASNDAEGNLRGYRVYRSTDGTTWTQLGTTTSTSYADTHAKTLNSVRFYVVAYDSAGNVSAAAPTPVISLTKNQCS